MKGLRGIVALLGLAVGRARAAPGLATIRLCGVLVAVTLVAGVALYSAAMGDAMLQASLSRDPSSPYITMITVSHALDAAQYDRLDRYVRRQAQSDLGLPLLGLHVHHYTATAPVYRASALSAPGASALGDLALHYYEGFAAQVRVVAGALDGTARTVAGALPVAISQYTAQSLRLALGDRLRYSYDGHKPVSPPLVVTAIYVPRDVQSLFWDLNAGDPHYRSLVMLNLHSYLAVVSGASFNPDYFWQYHTNLKAIHLANTSTLLDALQRVNSKLSSLAPGTSLLSSIDLDIDGFLNQYDLLPYILFILVAPIVALVLYAVAVTTALVLDRQAGEIVLMRSRGAARSQVFALYVLEGIVLGIVAMALGPLLGLPLARLIGHANGFLSFGGGLPVDLRLTPQTYLLAGATALFSVLAGLVPALGLTRRSMTAFRQEQARLGRRPLWQRLFLDVVVLAVALYGLVVLIRQGPTSSSAGTAAVAQDPVIGLAPLLFAVALALLLSRVLPWLAALGLYLLRRLSSPPAHVALQSVARAPRQPMRLVQLCTLTLTLGVFAATVAGIEGSNRADQQIYDAGAQLRLQEYNVELKAFDALPLADHLRLPGVRAATPALRFESAGNIVNVTSDGTTVNVLGVDPTTAHGVMWFRPDFADLPFAQLLRAVAAPGPNAIVSASFLATTGLHRGDTFDVTLASGRVVHGRVAAVVRYFPTLDPRSTPFVITNLAYLRRASHSPGASEVWLATTPSQATVDRIMSIVASWPRHIIADEGVTPRFSALDDPLAAGIYGVVSVGFLIALALALLGFFAYAYLSLQRRLSEFAIVRALGLSSGQLRWLLLFEQFFLLGAGILGGIAAGALTTRLFLPYLPLAAETLPPFLVVIPWPAIVEFVAAVLLAFVVMLSGHVYMLLRLQLGRVLRLGEV